MKRKGTPVTTQIVSGLMAVFALGGSLLAQSPPLESLAYGLGAYVVGRVLSGVWCALFPIDHVGLVTEPGQEGEAEPEGHEERVAA